MAIKSLPNSFFCILNICLTLSSILNQATAGSGGSLTDDLSVKQTQPANQIKRNQIAKPKITLYWHDVVSGKNPTAVPIVKPINKNSPFGGINMIDDLLTLGPDLSSEPIGRAQGFYAGASLGQEFAALMAMNFVFTSGEYNGSTITIMGRNAVLTKVREMPVIGGTGLFRFACGYVEAQTYTINTKTGDATVKYDVYVMQ